MEFLKDLFGGLSDFADSSGLSAFADKINTNEAFQNRMLERAQAQQALNPMAAPTQYSPYVASVQEQIQPEGQMYDQNAWDEMFQQVMFEDMFGSNPLLDYDRRDYGNPWG